MRTIRVQQVDDDLILRGRRGWGFITVGLLVAAPLAVQARVYCQVVPHVLSGPTPKLVLLCVAFGAMLLCCAGTVFWLLFTVEHLRVGREGIEHAYRVLVRFHVRRVPPGEVLGVAPDTRLTGDGGRTKVEHAIRIVTSGQPLRFGAGISEAEAVRLSDLVHRHVQSLERDRSIPGPLDLPIGPTDAIEVLDPAKDIPPPPSDCRIRHRSDWRGTELVRRGPFNAVLIALFSPFVVILDAGLSLIILERGGRAEWWRWLAISPILLLCGLIPTLAWVATVGAPLYVRRWAMSPYEVTSGWSVLGLGRTRSVEATELGRVELRSRSRMDGDTVYTLRGQ